MILLARASTIIDFACFDKLPHLPLRLWGQVKSLIRADLGALPHLVLLARAI